MWCPLARIFHHICGIRFGSAAAADDLLFEPNQTAPAGFLDSGTHSPLPPLYIRSSHHRSIRHRQNPLSARTTIFTCGQACRRRRTNNLRIAQACRALSWLLGRGQDTSNCSPQNTCSGKEQ